MLHYSVERRILKVDYYLGLLNEGYTLSRVANDMVKSSEFSEYAGNTTGKPVDATIALQRILKTVLHISEGDRLNEEVKKWSPGFGVDNYGTDTRGDAILDLIKANRDALASRVKVVEEYTLKGGGTDWKGSRSFVEMAVTDPAAALAAAAKSAAADKQDLQLSRLYVAILGRAADATGFKFWRESLASGADTLQTIAEKFLTSVEFEWLQPGTILTASQYNNQLVRRLYLNLLGHLPDATSQAAAVQAMGSDARTRAAWIVQFTEQVASFTGSEASAIADRKAAMTRVGISMAYTTMPPPSDDVTTQIAIGQALLSDTISDPNIRKAADNILLKIKTQRMSTASYAAAAELAAGTRPLEHMQLQLARLYAAVLDRAPDQVGFDWWLSRLLANPPATLTSVVESMLAQDPELSGKSDSEFIKALYTRAFGHSIDNQVQDAWIGKMAAQGRPAAVVELINGVLEGRVRSTQAGRDYFNNKVATGLTYVLYMDGNDTQTAKTILKKVTSAGFAAAIEYAYQPTAALAAALAKATADATKNAAEIIQGAAGAARELLKNTKSAEDLAAAMAANPMAKHLLTAARFYVAILQRGPSNDNLDMSGLINMATAMFRGEQPWRMAQVIFDSDEGRKLFSETLQPDEFIGKLYMQLLKRAPNAGELQTARLTLANNVSNRGKVANDILTLFIEGQVANDSAAAIPHQERLAAFHGEVGIALEAISAAAAATASAATRAESEVSTTNQARINFERATEAAAIAISQNKAPSTNHMLQVARLYVGLLGRNAATNPIDFDGMMFWTRAFQKGQTQERAAERFIFENPTLFPAEPRAFVDAIFRRVLDRGLASDEVFWVTALEKGNRTRAQIAVDIIDSLMDKTVPTAQEYHSKAEFNRRVEEAVRAFSTASSTTAGIAAAASEAAAADKEQARLYGIWQIQAAVQPESYADVIKAQRGVDFLASPDAVDLQKLLVAFGRSTAYETVASTLAKLAAGTTSFTQLVKSWVGTLGTSTESKTAFFKSLYDKILKRSPDPKGLSFWVEAASNSTDAGWWAYDFYVKALDELHGIGEGAKIAERKNFQTEYKTVITSNTTLANKEAGGYSAARQAAADDIGRKTTAAKQDYDNAYGDYSAKKDLNEAAKVASAALKGVINIQAAAVTAAKKGEEYFAAQAHLTETLNQMNEMAANWSIDKIRSERGPIVDGANAVKPDAELSSALSGIAGATLSMLLNAEEVESADLTTKHVVQITQLYTVLFGPGKTPTMIQLNSALLQLRDGASLEVIADTLISRQAALSGGTNAAFIEHLFFNAMQRTGVDPDGLAFWLNTMEGTERYTRGQVAIGLINSLMRGTLNGDTRQFTTNVADAIAEIGRQAVAAMNSPNTSEYVSALVLALRDESGRFNAGAESANSPQARFAIEITQLYTVLLGRPPEPSALMAAVQQRQDGTPLVVLAESILASSEIEGRIPPTSTNAAFIEALFSNAVRRPPTAKELVDFESKLSNGSLTRSALVSIFIADTYAYSGPDLAIETGRTVLMNQVATSLDRLADSMQSYALALTQTFQENLERALKSAAEKYIDFAGYRQTLDSTATAALQVRTAPDRMKVDRWGNVTEVSDIRNPGYSTKYVYNANNQVISTTVQKKNGPVEFNTNNRYDALGRIVSSSETGKLNGTTTTTQTTRYEYNSRGVVEKEVHADGGFTRYDIDNFGQRTASYQYLNNSSSVNYKYDYDQLGRLIKRSSAAVDIYAWTGAPNSSSNKAELVELYEYDELGRRTSTLNTTQIWSESKHRYLVSEAVDSITSRYDISGNNIFTSTTRGYSSMVSIRAFDALNNKVRESEASSDLNAGSGALMQEWRYDGFGRLQWHSDLGGNVTQNSYSNGGQISSSSKVTATPQGVRTVDTTYSYDVGTGRLIETKAIHGSIDSSGNKVIDTSGNLNQLARYSYDRAGHRITEQTWMLGANDKLVHTVQDQLLTFDARGRLSEVKSFIPTADYHITYELDDFGNRSHVTTTYADIWNSARTIKVHYIYDVMNRVIEVSGSVNTVYDENDVVMAPVDYNYPIKDTDGVGTSPPEVRVYYDNQPIGAHKISYDWAGNRISDNTETYEYDNLGRLAVIKKSGSKTGYRRYDDLGRIAESMQDGEIQINEYGQHGKLASQRTLSGGVQRSNVIYRYDKLGYLEEYSAYAYNNKNPQVTKFEYGMIGESRQLTRTTVENIGTDERKESQQEYDANGYLIKGTGWLDRTLINDLDGRVLEKVEAGVRNVSLIANGQMIGSSGAGWETFSSVHETISSASGAPEGTSIYVVKKDGEKLTTIAKGLWGDERLWHLIADANGITSIDEDLKLGRSLVIPAKVTLDYNGAETFKPYDAAEVVGSTTPQLALPKPVGPDAGCGTLGMIIVIVVAVVVTVATYGYFAPEAVSFVEAVAYGAMAGAAGSVASQAVGMAIGVQDDFSWKAVALAAISGGVTKGIGVSGLNPVVSAAVANVVTQGVAIATGLQDGFQWRSVAASSIGAAVGSGVNSSLNDPDGALYGLFGDNTFAKSAFTSFAAGSATAIARGGKIAVVQIAADAFGNALGSSLASRSSGTPDLRADEWDKIKQEVMSGDRYASTAMDPRQNWVTVARGGRLSPNPDGPDFPAGVLDDGEEYTKQTYSEGDRSFPVVQTAKGVYAYPAEAGEGTILQVIVSGKEARAALLASDAAAQNAAIAEYNAEIQSYNAQVVAEAAQSNGGWADSRQPDQPALIDIRQKVAGAASVVSNLSSSEGWASVGAVLRDSLRNSGGVNGPGFDVRRGPVITATAGQQTAAVNTLLSVPAFFGHELAFTSAIAPISVGNTMSRGSIGAPSPINSDLIRRTAAYKDWKIQNGIANRPTSAQFSLFPSAQRINNPGFAAYSGKEWPPNMGFKEQFDDYVDVGYKIDRYGYGGGRFVSPAGESYRGRALRPGTDKLPYNAYEVVVPMPVKYGPARAWFGYEGGAPQILLPDSIDRLLAKGWIR